MTTNATATAMAPSVKERRKMLAAMTPELRKVAEDIGKRLNGLAVGEAIVYYDIGEMIKDTISAPGAEVKYGEKTMEALAAYHGRKVGVFRAYLRFADAFERSYVVGWTKQQMPSGDSLSLGHWLQIAQVVRPEDREKLLKTAVERSLSVDGLAAEIEARGSSVDRSNHVRAGGRKHGLPSTPVIGLQRLAALATSLVNYEEQVGDEAIFGPIDEMGPEQVEDVHLSRLKETHEALDKAASAIAEAQQRIDTNLERVKRILDAKAHGGEESSAKKPKAEKKADAKPAAEANGKPAAADDESGAAAKARLAAKKKAKKAKLAKKKKAAAAAAS